MLEENLCAIWTLVFVAVRSARPYVSRRRHSPLRQVPADATEVGKGNVGFVTTLVRRVQQPAMPLEIADAQRERGTAYTEV